MSNQTFPFPPPPPPPPRRVEQPTPPNGRGGHREYGPDRGRGTVRGGWPNRGYSNGRGRGFDGGSRRGGTPTRAGIGGGQKRDHFTAFNNPNHTRTRPQAAPAVPSFNASIESLLPPRPSALTAAKPKLQSSDRKGNVLGLTPVRREESDSENEEDEEVKLASAADGLQFEYRGHVATLRTSADIAAWLAERRRRYPTQAKIAAAKKEAEEKQRLWEEQKNARLEASRKAREQRDLEHKKQREARLKQKSLDVEQKAASKTTHHADPTSKARLHAEKLRHKALKAQRDLEAAERALTALESGEPNNVAHQTGVTTDQSDSIAPSINESQSRTPNTKPVASAEPAAGNDAQIHRDLGDNLPEILSDLSELSESDITSSSGSDSDSDSDLSSDSDSAPEVSTSKRQQPDRVHLAARPPPFAATPCQYFMKTGRCKFGRECRYSHDRPRSLRDTATRNGNHRPARKGLWQVMVEKEQEEEQKRVLRAIIMLGDKGMLEEPQTASDLL